MCHAKFCFMLRLVPLLALGLLIACQTPPPPEPMPPPAPAELDRTPAPQPEPPAPPKPRPENLLGLAPADLLPLLGPPDLLRRDGQTQLHQYANDHCVLDLVFFEETDGPFKLSDFDSRDPLGRAYDGSECLDQLLTRAKSLR